MYLDSESQPYLFASSHLSASSSWTVTTVKLNYTVSGMNTHSVTIYRLPPRFPCIKSPIELCPPNDNVIVAVTHTFAFQSLQERKHAREFRSLCELFSDVPKDSYPLLSRTTKSLIFHLTNLSVYCFCSSK